MLKSLFELVRPPLASDCIALVDARLKERLNHERFEQEIKRLEAKSRAEITEALREIRAHRAAIETGRTAPSEAPR
jgi:hypothetical protein